MPLDANIQVMKSSQIDLRRIPRFTTQGGLVGIQGGQIIGIGVLIANNGIVVVIFVKVITSRHSIYFGTGGGNECY